MVVLDHLPHTLLEIRGGHDRLVSLQGKPGLVLRSIGRFHNGREDAIDRVAEQAGQDDLCTAAFAVVGEHGPERFVAAAGSSRPLRALRQCLRLPRRFRIASATSRPSSRLSGSLSCSGNHDAEDAVGPQGSHGEAGTDAAVGCRPTGQRRGPFGAAAARPAQRSAAAIRSASWRASSSRAAAENEACFQLAHKNTPIIGVWPIGRTDRSAVFRKGRASVVSPRSSNRQRWLVDAYRSCRWSVRSR